MSFSAVKKQGLQRVWNFSAAKIQPPKSLTNNLWPLVSFSAVIKNSSHRQEIKKELVNKEYVNKECVNKEYVKKNI